MSISLIYFWNKGNHYLKDQFLVIPIYLCNIYFKYESIHHWLAPSHERYDLNTLTKIYTQKCEYTTTVC